jgi:hypothetical protein
VQKTKEHPSTTSCEWILTFSFFLQGCGLADTCIVRLDGNSLQTKLRKLQKSMKE